MMDHSCNMLEKPLMRTVSNPIDVLVIRPSKFRPTFGNDGPNTSETDRFQDDTDDLVRVIEHDATKSDVDRRWTSLKELNKVIWWGVLRRLAEEEAANIYEYVNAMEWGLVDNSDSPMCGAQSIGFGTKAGDQQYVKGIFSVCASIGASNMATSSRSIDRRHLLMISPSLNNQPEVLSKSRLTYPCQVIHSTTV